MARGFLSGVVWGGLFSGICLGAWSLSADYPSRSALIPAPSGAVDSTLLGAADPRAPVPADPPAPEATDPKDTSAPVIVQAPDAGAVTKPKPDLSEPGRRPVAETGIDRPDLPKGGLNAPTAPVAVGADTTPLAPPLVGAAPDLPGSGLPAVSTAPVIAGRDAPIKPGAGAPLPDAPTPEGKPIIVTGPAQPPAPAVPNADSALVDVTPEPAFKTVTLDPVAPAPETQDPVTPAGQTTDPVTPDPAVAPAPAPLFEQAEPLPEPVIATQPPVAPTVGKPARSLVGRAAEPQEDPAPQPAPAEGVTPVGALTADSPLIRFAAKVDAPADVPRMAVVLVDDGSGPLGPSGLQSFPFPVSFAIAPAHPDAAAAVKGYRDLGFEVLVLGDLPEGARASDVEVTMSGILEAVPQAVAVLEAPGGSLQENRAIAGQVASYLAGSGRGLVMQPKGLNTAQKLALKDGVPAVTVFRDFDGEGQDATVIRRTLDQAAFRARQEGGVVMMGRLRADTITALVLWGLQDRSDSIALVPVSTLLTEAVAGQ